MPVIKNQCPSCESLKDTRAKKCQSCHLKGLMKQEYNYGGKGRITKYPIGYERIDHEGYVTIKTDNFNHPRYHQGWIRKHVHVMEQQLGRYLLPGESVHHKNGIRIDNHPSNLELWVKRQPTGQRVEDLLEWAHEIVSLYDSTYLEIGMVMC